MTAKIGIEETKDVMGFLCAFGNATGKSLDNNGRIDMGDIGTMLIPLGKLPEAISGANEVAAELKDLDAAERAELVAYCKEHFDIPDDEMEGKIERGLSLGVHLFEWINSFRKKPTT